MKNLNRRGFLKKSISGAAGIALTPAILTKTGPAGEGTIFRTLGKTGMKIPVVSFGVMRADNPGLCKAAYEKGIRLFDTANGYQNGNNETMLGNVLKAYPRNSFYLATKVKLTGTDDDGKPTPQTNTEDFLSKFQVSLSRLQMDYVDILYVHDVSNTEIVEYKPVIKVLQNLKKEGKIRFMGFSTHRNEPDVINAAALSDTWDVILTSYNFKQSYRKELDAAVRKAAGAGIGIIAMKTMAGGGFLDKERTKPMNTTAAIKWVLSNTDITTVIPGMTNFDQLDLDSKILADITLSDKEKNDIIAAASQPDLFCTGCLNCIKTCPRRLPVPDIMRAYMYAYGYADKSAAYSLLNELGTGSDPCRDCTGNCKNVCTKKFNIREKIADISRIINIPGDFLV